MRLVECIALDLPNFPDDLIRYWLLPYAESLGWPPFPKHRKDIGDSWKYILTQKGLSYWASLVWRKERMAIQWDDLSPRSQYSIEGVTTKTNGFEVIANSHQRIHRILVYFMKLGTWPVAPALVCHNNLYKVIDGNHRLAAFYIYKRTQQLFKISPLKKEHEVWVAT
jgi:hypothetical protein